MEDLHVWIFLKEVSYAHQGCIGYCTKDTVN